MDEKQPTLAVWRHVLARPIATAAAWRLCFYYKRRYPNCCAPKQLVRWSAHDYVGTFTVTAIDPPRTMPDGSTATETTQMSFSQYLSSRAVEGDSYSLTLPLQRLKSRRAQVLMSDGEPHPVRIEPATGAAFGIDFDLYDVLATSRDAELITDPVAREHAEALIHLYDDPPITEAQAHGL